MAAIATTALAFLFGGVNALFDLVKNASPLYTAKASRVRYTPPMPETPPRLRLFLTSAARDPVRTLPREAGEVWPTE